MNKCKAKIEQDTHGTGLWIIVEHHFEPIENTRIAISEEELLPISTAIDEYLIKKSQEKSK